MGCLKLTYDLDESPLFVSKGAENARKSAQGFISTDPLKDDYPQLNPYNYAGNKPVTHIDIDGLQSSGDKPNKNHPKPISTTVTRVSEEGFIIKTTSITAGNSVFSYTDVLAPNGEVLQSGKESFSNKPEPKPKEDNRAYESNELESVTITAEAFEQKKGFSTIANGPNKSEINNFVYQTTGGIHVSRQTTDQRRFLGAGIDIVSINPVIGVVKIGIEVANGTADSGTGRDALTSVGDVVKDLSKLSKGVGIVLNSIDAAEKLSSDPTRQEILTEIIFDAVLNGAVPEIKNATKVNLRDDLIFIQGETDVNKVIRVLNNVFNDVSAFTENIKDENFTKEQAVKAVREGYRNMSQNKN